jgi:hypothetical protein
MDSFYYRYNRFTQSYLINYNNNDFEADPELYTILQTYHEYLDHDKTISELTQKEITISKEDLTDILTLIQPEPSLTKNIRSRTFKLFDFQNLEFLLRHKKLVCSIFLILFLYSILTIDSFLFYLSLPRTNFFSTDKILLIIPIYYFSRFLFTPIHEFGHHFFYYLFTGKQTTFYIQIPGIMYFSGITSTDYLFYIKNPFKRILISLGGLILEFIFLQLVLVWCQFLGSFVLQILTLRVFLSFIFNLNFLSSSTDGHLLVTDLLGFTTFYETYNDYLRHFFDKSYELPISILKKVQIIFIGYTITGVLFIGLLVLVQFRVFLQLVQLFLLPVFNLQELVQFDIITIFLLVLTYLYYIDLGIRMFAKRVIFLKILDFRTSIVTSS